MAEIFTSSGKLFTRWFFALAWVLLGTLSASAQLTANFTANLTSGCEPLVVNFTDASTGSPTSWSWDFGNGSTSTNQNASAVYLTAGTYTVKLTVSNGTQSNTVTKTGYITVAAKPNITFAASDTLGCAPKTLTFTSAVTQPGPGPLTYTWDFGNGATSSVANPVYMYPAPGIYTVALAVSNGAGCASSASRANYINIRQKPAAGFNSNTVASCSAPVTVNFSNTSTTPSGNLSYSWDFGDNTAGATTTSPSHVYAATGTYTVRLIANNGICTDTFFRTITVSTNGSVPSFTAPTSGVCINTPLTFTNTSAPAPASVRWTFGDGTSSTDPNPTKTYSAPGTYTVTLNNFRGACTTTTTRTVQVSGLPTASFTANPTASCTRPLTVSFSSTSTGATSYQWDFGNGNTGTGANVSYTYVNNGTFQATLTTTNAAGCSTTSAPEPIRVGAALLVVGVNGNYCVNTPIRFNASVNPNLAGTTITWNFGDGNSTTTTGTTTNHAYAAAGTYTLQATANLPGGCTATATRTVVISTKISSDFTATPLTACIDNPVTFSATNSGASAYYWIFGDGTSSVTAQQKDTTHTYTGLGTYGVRLVVDNNGCKDTLSKPRYVSVSGPKAQFTNTYSCANIRAQSFTNTSLRGTSYLWNFGNGATSTQPNPSYTYPAYGTYTVSLTATDGTCSSTVTRVLRLLNTDSFFTATSTTVCPGAPATFNLRNAAGIQSVRWLYGDGDSSGSVAPGPVSHAYAARGSYSVTAIITDSLGCSKTFTRPNYITVRGVTADFTANPLPPCAPGSTTFTDQSSAPGTTITSRTWYFGDGSAPVSSSTSSVSHTYNALGSYDVSLVVTDGFGCRDSIAKPDFITPANPQASFTVPGRVRCVGEFISFTNTSTNSVSYSWNFGDGTTDTARNPSKAYSAPGTYSVQLTARAAGGCTSTSTTVVNITVIPNAAAFNMSDSVASCPPLAVQLTASNATPAGTTYSWDFGNGATSNTRNPTVVYTYPGNYTIRLVATTPTGCIDTFSRVVRVFGPTATLTYTPTGGCIPLTVNFAVNGQSTTSVTYDFDDGTVFTTTAASSTRTHTYATAGVYVPKLVLGSLTGCRVALVGADTIRVGQLNAGFSQTPNSTNICAGQSIQFTDTSRSTAGPVTTWAWNFGDGTTDNVAAPVKIFTLPGTYRVRLTVTAGNCTDTISRLFTVRPSPTVTVSGGGTICTGTSTQLTASGANTYQWIAPTTGLSCTTCVNPVASPTTQTTYTVVGTNTVGCSDTAQVLVDVQPKPTVTVSPNVAICSGNSTQLTASGATAYVWSPAAGLSNPNIANPTAAPAVTTTYRVIGSYGSGSCSDTDSVVVTVNPSPILTVSPNTTTICSGNSVQLQATGAGTYTWTPAAGLSNPNIANPVATPLVTTTYTVTGTNPGNCVATRTVTITVNASPVLNAGPDKGLCPGQTYTIPNVGTADSYSWTPTTGLSNPASPSPTVSAASVPDTTQYVVTGTNLNGCIKTDTVNIITYPGITVNAGNDTTVCSGAFFNLSATATATATYQWTPTTGLNNPNTASPVASLSDTTTFYVIALSANGCSDTDSVVVNVLPSPVVTVGNNLNLCLGSSTQLNATSGPGVTYAWTPTLGLSNPNIPNPIASPTSQTTYQVVGTAANGCTDTATVGIYILPKPTVTATASQTTVCYGQSITLSATGANSYTWDPALGLVCATCPTTTAVVNTTRSYYVVGATNGCTDTALLAITVNPLPVVRVQPDTATICEGQSIRLVATGAATYGWSPVAGLTTTSRDTTFASPVVNTVYQVTGRSLEGCTATANSVIVVNPVARVQATADDTTICEGSSTTLRAFGALNYEWYPAAGLSCTTCASPVADPVISTTYRVIGTGPSLCPDTTYIHITVTPKPDLLVTPGSATLCAGDSISFNASSTVGGVYSWAPADGLSCTNCTNPTAQPAATTVYTVKLTAGTGCSVEKQVPVTVKALPEVDAGPDRAICAGISTQLTVTGAATYVWSPANGLSCTACKDPYVTLNGPATYLVTGTDLSGCSNTDTLNLTVVPSAAALITPDTTLCLGSAIRLQATGGTSYLWMPATGLSNPRIANPTASPTQTTTYRVAIANADCYVDTLSVTITVVPLPVVNAGADAHVASGSSSTLNGNVPADVVKYYWTPVDFLSCNDCLNPVATPRNTITYTLHGISNYGCEGTDEVTLFTKCSSSQIFMPNTFTPNGDGQNDRFYPRGSGLKTVTSFRIFSRWGEMVYEAQNINLNDESAGWDGTFKSQPLKPDTYVWMLEGVCESGDPITIKGDISIIR